jgi:hypothetical protein
MAARWLVEDIWNDPNGEDVVRFLIELEQDLSNARLFVRFLLKPFLSFCTNLKVSHNSKFHDGWLFASVSCSSISLLLLLFREKSRDACLGASETYVASQG